MKPYSLARALPASLLALATLSQPAAARDYTKLYGNPAPVSSANHTITIGPDTRYVNVQGGNTVNFVSGDKSFAWTFNVARTVRSFDLAEVAPPGVLDHGVTAYVAPDPKYLGP